MKNLLQNVLWSTLLLTALPVFSQDFNIQLRSALEYPGQTLANIYGYAQNGREYALVGASQGLIIVDVTDPDKPVNIVQIPGPNSLWKEIKTYSHYAYIVSEGGQGIQIVDLSALPSPNLNHHFYNGKGQLLQPTDSLNRIHALHIDLKKGFLYAYGGGGDVFGGAAKVFDLKADPYNPSYAGKFDELGYIHDGYADNDTLYAGHIYDGLLSIVDMSDKGNPVLLGTVQTPGAFTHNTWLLDDHKHILTTDERVPSFLTAYDISDPQDIKELDRISTNGGYGSLGHNTHVLNDWAITSWYTDGVLITDAHRPQNLVHTGWYDTWPGTGASFDGCWGVYPFLPSGNIVATNIPSSNGGTGKLFVLSPTYLRACYLEGSVKNACTGLSMKDVKIEVSGNNPWIDTKTAGDGTFRTGQWETGDYVVTVSTPGFIPQTFNVNFERGKIIELNVILQAPAFYDINGVVRDAQTKAPIANAPVVLANPNLHYDLQTNAAGQFSATCTVGGDYSAISDFWGYLPADVKVNQNGSVTIELQKGYYDDFGFDLGWTSATDSASLGFWTRAEPIGTNSQGAAVNPDFDVNFDGNEECYVTGNGGGGPGFDDVDDGGVTLSCPPMQLSGYQDAVLTFYYWFYNGGGFGQPNDHFEVQVTNDNQSATVFTQNASASEWRASGDIHLKNYISLADNVQIHFIARDSDPSHVVEAAVDAFKVVPVSATGVRPEIDASATVAVVPNPSAGAFRIRYDWPAAQEVVLEVRNLVGQTVLTQELGTNSGTLSCGDHWPKGVYIVSLRSAERQSAPLRMVKQ